MFSWDFLIDTDYYLKLVFDIASILHAQKTASLDPAKLDMDASKDVEDLLR